MTWLPPKTRSAASSPRTLRACSRPAAGPRRLQKTRRRRRRRAWRAMRRRLKRARPTNHQHPLCPSHLRYLPAPCCPWILTKICPRMLRRISRPFLASVCWETLEERRDKTRREKPKTSRSERRPDQGCLTQSFSTNMSQTHHRRRHPPTMPHSVLRRRRHHHHHRQPMILHNHDHPTTDKTHRHRPLMLHNRPYGHPPLILHHKPHQPLLSEYHKSHLRHTKMHGKR